MRIAIYARVSTSDKDQEPETQLMPLRDFCEAQDWDVYGEYVDRASANDQAHRIQAHVSPFTSNQPLSTNP